MAPKEHKDSALVVKLKQLGKKLPSFIAYAAYVNLTYIHIMCRSCGINKKGLQRSPRQRTPIYDG